MGFGGPMRLYRLWILTAFILTACGGGGGGGSSSSSTPPPPATYSVGGTVSGLGSGNKVVLQNGTESLTVSANGSFTFLTTITSGGSYSVSVATQPTGQTCTLSSGSGTVTANVTSVSVACTVNTFTIGGSVTGLASGQSVVLLDNAGDALTVSSNTTFTFKTPINYGSGYAVTVGTQPTGQTCTVSNGTSSSTTANISNVAVACTTNTYTIGGTVTGLLANTSLTVQLNSGNSLNVSSNGSFTFASQINYGTAYSVTVLNQPASQTCTVTNGTGTITNNISSVNISCSLTPVFKPTPDISIDVSSYMNNMCGAQYGFNIQHVIPIDLNHDGKTDLLVSMWCSTAALNSTTTQPDISYLVAFIQQPDGTFVDQTKQIFGIAPVDLGASTAPGYLISDFNGDGYPDIAFGINREDGRGVANGSRLSPNAVMMSNGANGYTLSFFGPSNYASHVDPVDNASGTKDFVLPSFSSSPFRWSYVNGSWTSSEYDFVGSNGTRFFSRTTSGLGSTSALVSTQNIQNQPFGLIAYTNSNGSWNAGGSYLFATQQINESQNGVITGTTPMITLSGNNYAFADFGTNCLIKRSPSSQEEAIYDLNAQLVIGGYTGSAVVFGDPTQLKEADQLLAFSIKNGDVQNNTLTYTPALPDNLQPNDMFCVDVNGDGYQDIYMGRAISPSGDGSINLPVVYINDQNGNFRGVNSSTFPTVGTNTGLWNYSIADINGDGNSDLIYFAISSNASQLPTKAIQIYFGSRNFGQYDLVPTSTTSVTTGSSVVSILVSAATNIVQAGTSLIINAVATLTDGSQQTVSGLVTWVANLASGGNSSATVTANSSANSAEILDNIAEAVNIIGQYLGNISNTIQLVFSPISIGGTVTGLLPGNNLTLVLNGNITVTVAGTTSGSISYQFSAPLNASTEYTVAIQFQPGYETCSVSNGSGIISSNTTVNIICLYPVLSVSASNISFSSQVIGTSSASKNLVLTNNGTAAISISEISISGTNSAMYTQSNQCQALIPPNSICTVSIQFTPSSVGLELANLNLVTNIGTSVFPISGVSVGSSFNDAIFGKSVFSE